MGTSKCCFKWLILCYTENLSCVSFCKFWLCCRWTVQLLLCRQDTTYEGKFTCLCGILIRTISMRNYNLLIRNCIVLRPPFWKDRTTYRELRTMVVPSFCYGLIYLQLLTLLTTVYYSTDWRCVSREGPKYSAFHGIFVYVIHAICAPLVPYSLKIYPPLMASSPQLSG